MNLLTIKPVQIQMKYLYVKPSQGMLNYDNFVLVEIRT